MEIPDCYDPAYQAERLAADADRWEQKLRRCDLCHRRIYPGTPYRENAFAVICGECFEDFEMSGEHLENDIQN